MLAPLPRVLALGCVLLAAACRALGPDHRIVESASGREVGLAELADALARADVVFLGEEHDDDVVHRLQLELLRALLERRGELVLSLEMFERDVQPVLDLYLAGAIDEARFLAAARPWPYYAEHYRPAIELAREHGLRVVAANCPRRLARAVLAGGHAAVAGDPWAALHLLTSDADYRARFDEGAGAQTDFARRGLDKAYAAQCLKDETMAESIARVFDGHGRRRPLVVHWCGKFHSDHRLGTVSRLLRRRPDLEVAVVTTLSGGAVGRALGEEERARADWLWVVR